MKTSIKETVAYFNYFSYPPTLEEIHKYLRIKVSTQELNNRLQELVQNKHLELKNIGSSRRYTIQGYSSAFDELPIRKAYSELKLKKIKNYLQLLNIFPQIKLIGLSGSVAMNNAKKEDDIDLFVIAAKDRLWTARMICLLLAQLLGLRRKRGVVKAENKVCLNLFFEESELLIPKNKRNLYIAHEVLQMKQLLVRGNIYNRFIQTNNWIFDLLPNYLDMLRYGLSTSPKGYGGASIVFTKIGDYLERFLKTIQLYYIKRHQTTELLLQKQLWFHPDDFEKRVEKYIT